jgi:5'-nucleotidase
MQGYISVTPLQLDRTFPDGFSGMESWLESLL